MSPSTIRLPNGEEFEYYLKLSILYNPDDGSWRLVGTPDHVAEEIKLVREVLGSVIANYGTEDEGEMLGPVRKPVDTEIFSEKVATEIETTTGELAAVLGHRCAFCGHRKGGVFGK